MSSTNLLAVAPTLNIAVEGESFLMQEVVGMLQPVGYERVTPSQRLELTENSRIIPIPGYGQPSVAVPYSITTYPVRPAVGGYPEITMAGLPVLFRALKSHASRDHPKRGWYKICPPKLSTRDSFRLTIWFNTRDPLDYMDEETFQEVRRLTICEVMVKLHELGAASLYPVES